MTLICKTYVIMFTCFLVNTVQTFGFTQYYISSSVPNELITLVPNNYEKYCLSTDYKWKPCPKYRTSSNDVTPATKSYNLEDRIYSHRFMDKEFKDQELYNLFLSIPPSVPKSIGGLFRYWNWLLKNTPIELYSDEIPLPILNYRKGTELISSNKENELSSTSRLGTDPKEDLINEFIDSLDQLEKKFYATTYATLQAISPSEYVNGISFTLSGLFLQMALIALSTEVDHDTRRELDECTGFNVPEQAKIEVLKNIISWLPTSSDRLKFRYKTRLVVKQGIYVSEKFLRGVAAAGRIKVEHLNDTQTPEKLTATLNHMVEIDSGGALRNTFEEDELSKGICAVLISTVYLRARWRSPPTLLNGTFPFYDDERAPERNARMIRINDIMGYADLPEWDAEALEIKYATTGLTLVLVVPKGRSLRNLAAHMSTTSLQSIVDVMQSKRIAATLPLFTLRMTLLLPAKMQTMGITRLVDKRCDGLKLSHAIQRIMFWSEAGRYAFKDDGIEWDETPEQRIIFDRPYLFYVRWHNVTILNGNFVL
ncbi:glia-derived nexin-like isoform X1 [Pieris napi]|uniref:glia-derived nexin-like isoform X1 n=1 Tax=Pieris napi TaxID=78633 RepID=UPI001FBBD379|nr:glia-derived nexin-like isoform X1 [Pieris napi]